ncbi:unnamed protein product, partial [Allacma fusca]
NYWLDNIRKYLGGLLLLLTSRTMQCSNNCEDAEKNIEINNFIVGDMAIDF